MGAISLRWWLAYRRSVVAGFDGGLGIVAGLVALARFVLARDVSVEAAGVALGICALLTGWTHVIGGFDTPGTANRIRLCDNVLLGSFELLFGVLLLQSPTLIEAPTRPPGVSALLVGWGLVAGVSLLIQAWRRYAKLQPAPGASAAGPGAQEE